MATTAKFLTHCTVCDREVGAVLNWEKWQAGRLVGEYRISRHASVARVARTKGAAYVRRPMCPGGGFLVSAELVWPRDDGTAPQGPERQPEGPGGDQPSPSSTATR